MQTNDAQWLARAQAAVERGRVTLALQACLVTLVAPVVVSLIRFQGVTTVALGLLSVATVGLCVWFGRGLSAGAMHGLKAGLIPLVLSLAANAWGHVCIPGRGCSSLCVPACTAGGVMAGLAVEWWARRSTSPWRVRASAAVVSLGIGALGCSCVGSAGIAGLVLGYSASVALGAATSRLRRA